MIPRPIEAVDEAALNSLIENQVSEGKTMEYKRELSIAADSKKIPLLATVSSFANTAGGDLLIGVEAVSGSPVDLPGVKTDDVDAEKLRLEQVLRSGIEPRVPRVDIHPISLASGKYVWAIRVNYSWIAPHRVIRNSKFYARNSAGHYELDVGELRTAFTMSETIASRIRDFRTNRIALIHSRQTLVPLDPGGCMVVHILPLDAFSANTVIDILKLKGRTTNLQPMEAGDWTSRINLDGIVNFATQYNGSSSAYLQVFRSGVVESVSVSALPIDKGRMFLPSLAYEQDSIELLKVYLEFAEEFEIRPPYYVFLSFLGVRGCEFGVKKSPLKLHILEEDMLILPEVVIQNRDEQPHQALRKAFDMVWNSFGFIGSRNYDDSGNWKSG